MKIIALYLPQFHEIPENNEWWGEGFTEWTNVKKSKPLFSKHNQPRIPLNNNYYNLLDNDVKQWQIKIAKEYGVYGFCFYHYWFKDGKKLLEKPVEQFLENKELDFPFCLSWANEPWSRRWDGSEHKIIMPQEYGDKKEWKEHFDYLLPFWKDERYIKNNGKPLFVIYRPEIIPQLNEMIDYWQELAVENGLDGISFVYQFPEFYFTENKNDSRFDYGIEFEPLFSRMMKTKSESTIIKIKKELDPKNKNIRWYTNKLKSVVNGQLDKYAKKDFEFRFKAINLNNYDEIVEVSTNHNPISNKSIPGVFTDWDNSPRRGENNATLFQGSTPEKFKEYLSKQIKRAENLYEKEMIFINAWNEWAEGAYLEPDEKHGFAYLEAVRDALIENGYEVPIQKNK